MFKLRQSTPQWRRSIKMELSTEQLLEMIQTQQMVVQALTEKLSPQSNDKNTTTESITSQVQEKGITFAAWYNKHEDIFNVDLADVFVYL